MTRQSDVGVGRGTVPKHNDGGWALPGGRITKYRSEAISAAEALDAMIRARAAQANAAGIPEANQPPVITRRPATVDGARWTVSA